MAQITFHSMAESAYLWTAMHVADEKGVAYELKELVYRSPEHLRLHPFGKMPVMQHESLFLYETLAIAHYIDRAFDGPPLQPADARGQAQVLRWISIVNAYVFPTMNRFMKERLVRPLMGIEPDREFLSSAREQLELQMSLIDEAVEKTGYVAGSALTIADSFLFPHLLFLTQTPEGGAMIPEKPAAQSWLKRMRERPSYANKPMQVAFDAMLQLPRPELLWTE